jgi:hypothetical protein
MCVVLWFSDFRRPSKNHPSVRYPPVHIGDPFMAQTHIKRSMYVYVRGGKEGIIRRCFFLFFARSQNRRKTSDDPQSMRERKRALTKITTSTWKYESCEADWIIIIIMWILLFFGRPFFLFESFRWAPEAVSSPIEVSKTEVQKSHTHEEELIRAFISLRGPFPMSLFLPRWTKNVPTSAFYTTETWWEGVGWRWHNNKSGQENSVCLSLLKTVIPPSFLHKRTTIQYRTSWRYLVERNTG